MIKYKIIIRNKIKFRLKSAERSAWNCPSRFLFYLFIAFIYFIYLFLAQDKNIDKKLSVDKKDKYLEIK